MAATMIPQQLSAARAARAAPVRTRRARAAAVRASAEEAATKPDATVYYTSKSGARVTGTMEQARARARRGRVARARQHWLRAPRQGS